MIIKYFKCTLESDIVINASLATEGNMKSLNYIPGSNFLGIVAGKLYPQLKEDKKMEAAYDIFHSGKVSFGDAHILLNGRQSYTMPFSLLRDKLNKRITGKGAKIWLRHLLNKENRPKNAKGNFRQLKQHRSGYFTSDNKYIANVKKRFALKSAQERGTRKSKDEAMYGFDSIHKGQKFIFSIQFEKEKYIDEVSRALEGNRRLGKSKTAQYGQVKIEAIEDPLTFSNIASDKKRLVIYAESNLCFLNEYGQATFQPSLKDFKIEGKINRAASAIRTYSYSPWNGHRNTPDSQRDCILKGSVIIVDLESAIDIETLPTRVGNFQSEGLGRILYNPKFLEGGEASGEWLLRLHEYEELKDKRIPGKVTSSLGLFLQTKKQNLEKELKIGQAVQVFLTTDNKNLFEDISSSQWGAIRNLAIRAKNDMAKLKENLSGEKGFLTSGVSADKHWNKRKGKKIIGEELLKVIEENKGQGTTFVAKLATEMAKYKQRKSENSEI